MKKEYLILGILAFFLLIPNSMAQVDQCKVVGSAQTLIIPPHSQEAECNLYQLTYTLTCPIDTPDYCTISQSVIQSIIMFGGSQVSPGDTVCISYTDSWVTRIYTLNQFTCLTTCPDGSIHYKGECSGVTTTTTTRTTTTTTLPPPDGKTDINTFIILAVAGLAGVLAYLIYRKKK